MKQLKKHLLQTVMGLAFLLLTGQCLAQYDSTKTPQLVSTYGSNNNVGNFRGGLGIPHFDTTIKLAVRDSGYVDYFNRQIVVWTGHYWKLSSAGAAATMSLNEIVGTGAGPTNNTSVYTNTRLIGLSSKIQLFYNGIPLYNFGTYSSFTFDNTTGTINFGSNKFYTGGTISISLNQTQQ